MALLDDEENRAAFGIYPNAFRGNYGNPQDAANLPLDVLRGRLAGLLGIFGDVVNQPIAFTPARVAQLAMQGLSGQEQYKYPDTERFLKTLPLAPTSRAGEVAGQAGSFVPLNPAPVARAVGAGAQALGPTAANMAENFLQQQGLMLNAAPPKVSQASARNVKKGSVATVFDNVTDYNEAMKLAQKGAHLKQDPSGQYIGGPRSTGPIGLTVDSPGALSNMRRKADEKVEAGAFNASWYDRARQAAADATGYNPAMPTVADTNMASLFARGGAAYSPQATPPTEMNSFIRQHNAQVIGGEQIIPRTGSQARNVAKAYNIDPATGMYVLDPQAIRLGKKTGPYADAKDPTIPSTDLYKTASDIWHGRVMGYSDPGGTTFSRGFTPQEHGFLTGENLLLADRAEQKRLAGKLDVPDTSPDFIFDPRAAQAATWGAEREISYKAARDAEINRFTKSSAKYEKQLAKWEQTRKGERPQKPSLKNIGKESDESIRARARAGIDDAMQRQIASQTYEYIPGQNVMPGLNTAEENVRLAYSQGMQAPMGARDPYIGALQAYQLPVKSVMGEYLNSAGVVERNPAFVAQPLVGLIGSELKTSTGKLTRGGPMLDQPGRGLLDATSAVRAVMDLQEGVGWNKFTPANSSMKAVEKTGVRFQPMLTGSQDASQLPKQIAKAKSALEAQGLDVVDVGGALHAGKYDGSLNGKEIQEAVKKAKANIQDGQLFAGRFESNLQTPPWGAEGSGQVAQYLQGQLTRPDIQNFAQRLDSAGVPQVNAQQTEFMRKFLEQNKMSPRADVMKMRDIIGRQGYQGFLKYLQEFGPKGLPAVVPVGLLGSYEDNYQ